MKNFPVLCLGLLLTGHFFSFARADQIEMQNGDRYNGKVLAMTNSMLVLQSEILGTITLPREKVSQINLGDGRRAASSKLIAPQSSGSVQKKALPTITGRSTATNNSSATPAIADQDKLIAQVQDQFLAGAGPQATSKYQEMVNGFLTGQLSVADIRSQAKSAADQLRAARKDLGEDAGLALDGYLAILDSFLKDTAASSSSDSAKPAAPASPEPKRTPAGSQE